jgi:hypothetical protein
MNTFYLFAFVIHSLLPASAPPQTIYMGKTALWTVYYDDRKTPAIVEVSGIKYGHLDTLRRMDEATGGLLAASDKGELRLKNGVFIYSNRELKIRVRLKKADYTPGIDAQREKLFGVFAMQVINNLKRRHNRENYQMKRSVAEDYVYYRDTERFPEGYRPGFVVDFYENEKISE